MALTVIAQEFTIFRPLQEGGGGFLVLYTFLVLFLLKTSKGSASDVMVRWLIGHRGGAKVQMPIGRIGLFVWKIEPKKAYTYRYDTVPYISEVWPYIEVEQYRNIVIIMCHNHG